MHDVTRPRLRAVSAVAAPERAVAVDGVHKRHGQAAALRGVSLELAPGCVLALLGPEGAGKSTLLRVVSTLTAPDAGRVEVMGHDALEAPGRVRGCIALAGQGVAIHARLSVRETLLIVARLYGAGRHEARRRADATIERLALGAVADRRAGTLPRGLRRRVDLAACVVGWPPVVLLDEPTAGVDRRSREELWDTIEDLREQGTAVLLATTDLEEVNRLADRILVMDEGRVIGGGAPDALEAATGGHVLSLRLRSRPDDARALIAGFGVTRPTFTRDGRLQVALRDVESVTDVLLALRDGGMSPADAEVRRPRLEDVFFALTGAR